MATRKSPLQRVEEHRAKAEEIEGRERRRALRTSPPWRSTMRALGAINDAINFIDAGEPNDVLRDALVAAGSALTNCRAIQIVEPVQ